MTVVNKEDRITNPGSMHHRVLYSLVPGVLILLVLTGKLNTDAALHESLQSELRLTQAPKIAVRIDTVYGNRRVYTGDEENYRVRVNERASWPIKYEWILPGGIQTSGNNIIHKFEKFGKYQIDVVVSNRYGKDSARIWVYAVDRDVLLQKTAQRADSKVSPKVIRDDAAVEIRVLANDLVVEGTYYSWVVETYLNRIKAERALRSYTELGLSNLRVFEDVSGSGSTAFRVVIGKFKTQRRAVTQKNSIERSVRRSVSLITIRG